MNRKVAARSGIQVLATPESYCEGGRHLILIVSVPPPKPALASRSCSLPPILQVPCAALRTAHRSSQVKARSRFGQTAVKPQSNPRRIVGACCLAMNYACALPSLSNPVKAGQTNEHYNRRSPPLRFARWKRVLDCGGRNEVATPLSMSQPTPTPHRPLRAKRFFFFFFFVLGRVVRAYGRAATAASRSARCTTFGQTESNCFALPSSLTQFDRMAPRVRRQATPLSMSQPTPNPTSSPKPPKAASLAAALQGAIRSNSYVKPVGRVRLPPKTRKTASATTSYVLRPQSLGHTRSH